ncbi:hypothetical protein [Nesterenkonia halophila]
MDVALTGEDSSARLSSRSGSVHLCPPRWIRRRGRRHSRRLPVDTDVRKNLEKGEIIMSGLLSPVLGIAGGLLSTVLGLLGGVL